MIWKSSWPSSRQAAWQRRAQQFDLSQPAISIADLEYSPGVRLVDRTQRGVVEPTPYGLALTKRGKVVFDELKLGIQEIEFLADPTAGELRVGGSDPMVAGLIPAIIDRISRRPPRVAFRVIHGACDRQMFQALRQRDLDMFITRVVNETIDDDLHLEILFNEPFLVARPVATSWPMTAPDTRTIQAYLGHRSITHTVKYTALAPDRFNSLWRDQASPHHPLASLVEPLTRQARRCGRPSKQHTDLSDLPATLDKTAAK